LASLFVQKMCGKPEFARRIGLKSGFRFRDSSGAHSSSGVS
jgi:hypothetical protein